MSKVITKRIKKSFTSQIVIVSEFELIGNSPYITEIVSNKKAKN